MTTHTPSSFFELLTLAFEEDVGPGDITSEAIFGKKDLNAHATVISKQSGVLSGMAVAQAAFLMIDSNLAWTSMRNDGDLLTAGDLVFTVSGRIQSILKAERVALNILQHLSGVATLTRAYVDAISGTRAKLYDTRKTLPGFRSLEKKAVKDGGGENHRMGLYDQFLIKENHIVEAESINPPYPPFAKGEKIAIDHLHHMISKGGKTESDFSKGEKTARTHQQLADDHRYIATDHRHINPTSHDKKTLSNIQKAIRACRRYNPTLFLEVEVETRDELIDALAERPDCILLDNFSEEALKEAVVIARSIAPEILLDASGGVTLATVRAIAETGVDRISVGALTHSAPAFDFSLLIDRG